MPVLKTYCIFICHAWKQDSDYDVLVDDLTNSPLFLWRKCSNPDSELKGDLTSGIHESALTMRLTRQINTVHCVVVLASMYRSNRHWIDMALNFARQANKPIIAVRSKNDDTVPDEIKCVAKAICNWEIGDVLRTIRKYST